MHLIVVVRKLSQLQGRILESNSLVEHLLKPFIAAHFLPDAFQNWINVIPNDGESNKPTGMESEKIKESETNDRS
jgi:hypothetical protein